MNSGQSSAQIETFSPIYAEQALVDGSKGFPRTDKWLKDKVEGLRKWPLRFLSSSALPNCVTSVNTAGSKA